MAKKSAPAKSPARSKATAKGKRRREEEDEARGVRAAQQQFWESLRCVFFENASSTGLGTADALAKAVLDFESTDGLWNGPITLVPPPAESSYRRKFERHPDFDVPDDFDQTEGLAPPAKKRKTSADTVVAADKATFGFELPFNVDPNISGDLKTVFEKARAKKRLPYQLAYPWNGVELWYDPAAYPEVYLEHWRFWNKNRAVFWQCSLHPPLAKEAQGAFRKQKMNVRRARLRFISLCVETWGLFAFLRLLEEGNDQLMWLGGKPGKRSVAAKSKEFKGDPALDLAVLYTTAEPRYLAKIEGALDPKKIDSDGFSSVPSLLSVSRALDPDTGVDDRLSDRALARARLDLEAHKEHPSAWIDDEIAQKLLTNDRIGRVKVEDKVYKPKVHQFDENERKTPGYSIFKRKDGSFAALAPKNGGRADFDWEILPSTTVPDDGDIEDEDEDDKPNDDSASEVAQQELFGDDDEADEGDDDDPKEAGKDGQAGGDDDGGGDSKAGHEPKRGENHPDSDHGKGQSSPNDDKLAPSKDKSSKPKPSPKSKAKSS